MLSFKLVLECILACVVSSVVTSCTMLSFKLVLECILACVVSSHARCFPLNYMLECILACVWTSCSHAYTCFALCIDAHTGMHFQLLYTYIHMVNAHLPV